LPDEVLESLCRFGGGDLVVVRTAAAAVDGEALA
jgi:hypothetical protein